MTKIDLITGILGSGKTTFLRQYARALLRQGQKIAILVNDFGAVNVDMLLLQDLKGEGCRLEMVSGGCDADCHRRRLKTQLIALGMQQFDRILMEPSGIFDMDAFFDTLYESPLDRWFTVGSVLCVVDAGLPEQLTEQMEYLLATEAACAGKLLLSKTADLPSVEKTGEQVLSHVHRAMEHIQCRRRFQQADLVTKAWEQLTDAEFSELQNAGYRNESYVKRFQADEMQSTTHYFMHVRIPEAQILETIRGLMQDKTCGEIFRIKGFLEGNDGNWLQLNATEKQIELSPVAEGQAVLIVIGDSLEAVRIHEHLQAANTDPEYIFI